MMEMSQARQGVVYETCGEWMTFLRCAEVQHDPNIRLVKS